MSGEDECKDKIKKREEEEGPEEGGGEGEQAALESLKTTTLPAGR